MRELRNARYLGLVTVMIAASGLTTTSASAAEEPCAVVNVTRDTPAVSNLQAAIDRARSGDTLRIRGTCRGQFVIDRSLRLVGPDSRDRATIAAGREGRVLDVSGTEDRQIRVTLVNLRVVRGEVSGRGGGLRSAYTDLRLVNTLVARSAAGRGGGISSRGQLTLVDSRVTANQAGEGGGVIARGHLKARGHTRIDENAAGWAAGIWMRHGPMVMSGHSRVTWNQGGSAAAIATGTGRVSLRGHASVAHNVASNLVGGIFSYGGEVRVRDHASVRHNASAGDGGGIYSLSGRVSLHDHALVAGNTSGKRGGGILAYARVRLHDASSVERNFGQRGGGILVLGDDLVLSGTARIVENRAGKTGGGVLAVGRPRPTVLVRKGATITDNDPRDVVIRVREVVVPQA